MAPEKEKITGMILYVDLKCRCCYKKVRKLVCKCPQIRDQVFDVDKNEVTITVVCCDPEKLRDKLCCKGGGAIQSIEIVENKPPPAPDPPPPKPKPKPSVVIEVHKPHIEIKPSGEHESPLPVSACCQECYEGRHGGPCHYVYGYGRPVPPPPCYYYYGYVYPSNRPCYVSRCDYFSEDNPQGCSIM
ncbi:pyricularia oryzae resistance 21-like protein [Tanacetum coccineum]